MTGTNDPGSNDNLRKSSSAKSVMSCVPSNRPPIARRLRGLSVSRCDWTLAREMRFFCLVQALLQDRHEIDHFSRWSRLRFRFFFDLFPTGFNLFLDHLHQG